MVLVRPAKRGWADSQMRVPFKSALKRQRVIWTEGGGRPTECEDHSVRTRGAARTAFIPRIPYAELVLDDQERGDSGRSDPRNRSRNPYRRRCWRISEDAGRHQVPLAAAPLVLLLATARARVVTTGSAHRALLPLRLQPADLRRQGRFDQVRARNSEVDSGSGIREEHLSCRTYVPRRRREKRCVG